MTLSSRANVTELKKLYAHLVAASTFLFALIKSYEDKSPLLSHDLDALITPNWMSLLIPEKANTGFMFWSLELTCMIHDIVTTAFATT